MGVEPFVALQADQPRAAHGGQHLGDLGLADAGVAFQQQRAAEVLHQQQRRDQRRLGDVAGARQVGLPGGELVRAPGGVMRVMRSSRRAP